MMDTSIRLGLKANWTYYYEKLSTGSDQFHIFDVNLVFRFAQNEYAQFYVGLGGRGFMDYSGSKGGFNGSYFLNVYPVRPASIGLSIDLGNLGNAFYLQHKLKLGFVFSSLEIYFGYDFVKIGSVNFFGPSFGLQIWL